MTCTQCSGSHGLAASEAPWGQDLPLSTTAFIRGLLLKKIQQPRPPQRHGEVGSKGAAGCTKDDETWVPVSVP